MTEKQQVFNKLFLAYNALSEVYCNIKIFYNYLYLLLLQILISSLSLYLVYYTGTSHSNHINLLFTLIITLGLNALPFLQSIRITSELYRIQRSVYNLQQQKGIGMFQTILEKWIRRFSTYEVVHDCGYLIVDVSLLYFAFDLFTLFVFAMI